MIRSIEQLKKLNESLDIVNDLRYQKMVSLKKVMEGSYLPSGVWDTQEKTNGWNEIEDCTWNLLTNISHDYKLLTLWAESYIKISVLESIPFVFDVFGKIFEHGDILSDKEKEYCENILTYMDKHIALSLKTININTHYQPINWHSIEKFNKEVYGEFYSLMNLIGNDAIQSIQSICYALKKSISLMHEKLGHDYSNSFSQSGHMINSLTDFIEFRANLNMEPEEQPQQEQEEENELKSFAYYRKFAFNSIAEGTEILARIDTQNIVLPFLRKILKWKDLSLLEIFDDLGDAAQIEAFIKILKEKT